jgi:hypothetical protein
MRCGRLSGMATPWVPDREDSPARLCPRSKAYQVRMSGLVFHLHDLSCLAFLDHRVDAVPVQINVLHLRGKGLSHLHPPLDHSDRHLDVDRGAALLAVVHHLHPQVPCRLLRLLALHSGYLLSAAAVLDRRVPTRTLAGPGLPSGVADDPPLAAPAQSPGIGQDRCAHTHHCGPLPQITAEAKVPEGIGRKTLISTM